MDPSRKRQARFVVALTTALLLAGALVYTSFSAASEAVQPSQLHAKAEAAKVYDLTGKVQEGSWQRDGTVHTFRVRDREGQASVPVRYEGSVPDPFQEGREVIIKVRKEGDTFVGQKDSLVTKCPSKFSAEDESV
jgi:cytochrome c-type biogenesis protein CcmE